ncbi:glycosyltransferase [bacterium]|jgi:hypothetical protein|nr:glycosyltransferase [bacterium]
MASVLYITYDGLLEPLGMSQVWQYLQVLSKTHNIIIISFEKSTNVNDLDGFLKDVKHSGVSWYRLKYHKRPTLLATMYDVFLGFMLAIFLVKKYKIDIIHARSYIPSLIALLVNSITKTKFLFDMRGFWADEKVDGGVWSRRSLIYRVTKWLERKFFERCYSIISLTETGRGDINSLSYMKQSDKDIYVIPTCTNLDVFKPKYVSDIEVKNRFDLVLGYIGSVGTFYLFDEVLKSIKALNENKIKTKLLIINRGQHDYIKSKIDEAGISKKNIELKSVPYEKVSEEINKVDAGIFYIKPTFSKRSSSPTRLGEFLGCGKPCISNYGVGDTQKVLENNNVGVVLNGFSDNDHKMGVTKLVKLVNDPGIASRCVDVAKDVYSLDIGVDCYNEIYSKVGVKIHI